MVRSGGEAITKQVPTRENAGETAAEAEAKQSEEHRVTI